MKISTLKKETAPDRLDAIEGPAEDQQADSGPSKRRAQLHVIAPEKVAALRRLASDIPGLNTQAQERRVLAALELGPVTTFALMRYADVFDPRPRVLSLRAKGYEIDTLRVHLATESGDVHTKVGLYVLRRGGAA